MSHPFEAEISGLKEKLLVMGGHAERAAADAVRSLVQRDSELARAVLEKDAVLDRFEIEIDEDSIHILAGAPLAGDLGFITDRKSTRLNSSPVSESLITPSS